jgi:hypothetical protein
MRNSAKDFSETPETTGKVLTFPKGKIIKRELYCIPCAVEQPDFKERVPSYESGTYGPYAGEQGMDQRTKFHPAQASCA